jgi:hypothetical protein
MPDIRLPQWVFLSAAEYFKAIVEDDNSLKYFVEGEPRTTDKDEQYIEFRLDGPESEEVSRNYWHHDFEINLAITILQNEDLGRIHRYAGIIVQAMNAEIPIFKYGCVNDLANDKTFIGCLQLRREFRERAIVTAHFGQVEASLNIMQATVEGHFRLTLCED